MRNNTLAFSYDHDQIATPTHIVDFLSDLLNVPARKTIDPTAGNGAMLKFASECCGIEIDEKPFKDLRDRYPDGNFINASLFDCKDWIAEQAPEVVLMNPPFNEDKTKGLEFVRFTADSVGHGDLAAIVPIRALATGWKAIDACKRELLSRHTLKAVLKLNRELFYPATAANVAVVIFELGIPHNGDTWFADFENDGMVKAGSKGRIDKEDRWQTIKAQWLEAYREKATHERKKPQESVPCMVKGVTADDDWIPHMHIPLLVSQPTEEDFKRVVADCLAQRVRETQRKKAMEAKKDGNKEELKKLDE